MNPISIAGSSAYGLHNAERSDDGHGEWYDIPLTPSAPTTPRPFGTAAATAPPPALPGGDGQWIVTIPGSPRGGCAAQAAQPAPTTPLTRLIEGMRGQFADIDKRHLAAAMATEFARGYVGTFVGKTVGALVEQQLENAVIGRAGAQLAVATALPAALSVVNAAYAAYALYGVVKAMEKPQAPHNRFAVLAGGAMAGVSSLLSLGPVAALTAGASRAHAARFAADQLSYAIYGVVREGVNRLLSGLGPELKSRKADGGTHGLQVSALSSTLSAPLYSATSIGLNYKAAEAFKNRYDPPALAATEGGNLRHAALLQRGIAFDKMFANPLVEGLHQVYIVLSKVAVGTRPTVVMPEGGARGWVAKWFDKQKEFGMVDAPAVGTAADPASGTAGDAAASGGKRFSFTAFAREATRVALPQGMSRVLAHSIPDSPLSTAQAVHPNLHGLMRMLKAALISISDYRVLTLVDTSGEGHKRTDKDLKAGAAARAAPPPDEAARAETPVTPAESAPGTPSEPGETFHHRSDEGFEPPEWRAVPLRPEHPTHTAHAAVTPHVESQQAPAPDEDDDAAFFDRLAESPDHAAQASAASDDEVDEAFFDRLLDSPNHPAQTHTPSADDVDEALVDQLLEASAHADAEPQSAVSSPEAASASASAAAPIPEQPDAPSPAAEHRDSQIVPASSGSEPAQPLAYSVTEPPDEMVAVTGQGRQADSEPRHRVLQRTAEYIVTEPIDDGEPDSPRAASAEPAAVSNAGSETHAAPASNPALEPPSNQASSAVARNREHVSLRDLFQRDGQTEASDAPATHAQAQRPDASASQAVAQREAMQHLRRTADTLAPHVEREDTEAALRRIKLQQDIASGVVKTPKRSSGVLKTPRPLRGALRAIKHAFGGKKSGPSN